MSIYCQFFTFLLAFLPLGTVWAARPTEIEIRAQHFKLFPKKHEALWTGHVRARRDETRITCLKLLAFYNNDQKISRIDCQGNAEVQDGDRWARGDHARFESLTDIVTVTGAPQARQGRNLMNGTKVTLQLGGRTMEVENAKVMYKTALHPNL